MIGLYIRYLKENSMSSNFSTQLIQAKPDQTV
jgi:hypothetical protein